MSSLAGALSYPQDDTALKRDPEDFGSLTQPDVDMDAQPKLEPSGDDTESIPAQDQDMHDLFGEDNAVEDSKHEEPATPASSEHLDGISSPERKHREALEYAEEDEPEPTVEQVLEATAAIPNIPVPRSSDGNYWVIRTPNFVKVDSKPFHPDTYVGPEHEDEDSQQAETLREKSMTIKLKVENTVRWRWVKDEHGQDQRQSNSRIIRWSDGSLSLKLGKELFHITQTIDTSGAVPRQAIGGSQPQTQPSTPILKPQPQGLTYLVAQHKRAEILQCEALITGYMSLRPTGMQSETHRMLVRAVGQKHNKVARLRMAPDPTTDPEREKMELLKLASKKPKRSKGEDDGFGGSRRRRTGYTRKRTGDDMWSDDDDEEGFGGGGSEDEYGLGSAGDGKAKRRKTEETSRKGPGEYQTDDFLVSDSDEGGHDSEEGASKKRRSQKHREEDGDEDDLERLEAKLDQQQAEERKRKQRDIVEGEEPVADNAGGDDAMDVESEEDEEEEHRVRRAGVASSSRKKRTIEVEEEEED